MRHFLFAVSRALRAWDASRRRRRRGILDYDAWVRQHDSLDAATFRARALRLQGEPLISVLMPVYNPHPEWLRQALDSVCNQIHRGWELCIADDASTDPAVRELLELYAGLDHRIRVTYRADNGHISAASNSALALASGTFVALMDHDDVLPAHALLCIAETLSAFPEAGLVYSDEDKIDAQGRRCEPHFKPDWNPDLARCYNMVSHLGVYRTALVRALGGFRTGFEGAQDYDLALRCIDALRPDQIVHVPHVLYHWRVHAESTAMGDAPKPYALDAARRALAEHLARCGVEATIDRHPGGFFQLRHRLPPSTRVTVVVLDHGDAAATRRCIDGVRRSGEVAVVVAALAGRGARPAAIAATDWIDARSELSPGAACNAIAAATMGDVLIFIDAACVGDTDGWLEALAAIARRPGTGVVGPKLLGADGRIRGGAAILGRDKILTLHAGLQADDVGYYGRAVLLQDVTVVEGGCIAIMRERLQAAGGFSTEYDTLRAACIDLCLRLEGAGLRNAWVPDVHVNWHARAGILTARDAAQLAARWPGPFDHDRAYNPNCSLSRADFAPADPPRIDPAQPWFDQPGATR